MTPDDWIATIADVAHDWQDPDYQRRGVAVQATLEAPNRYTEEGLAFALNQRMQQLGPDTLRDWIGGRTAREARNVGIVRNDAPPLDGLIEAIAALVLGHRVWVARSEASPAIIAAFFEDLLERTAEESVRVVPRDLLFERADVLVASGTDERIDEIERETDEAGIPPERRWLHRHGLVVAVIDGREDAEARSGLAEDLLLHEGIAPRTPSLLWAPAGLDPDTMLDTLAGFREVYPVHPDTDGTLAMPTAFLASAKQSHAVGPGFLVSKGDPEPQAEGHIRWVEYTDFDEVAAWIDGRKDALDFVVARPHVAEQLDVGVPFVAPGDAHRPDLGDDVPGLVAFLANA
jgi:hypothetical protein